MQTQSLSAEAIRQKILACKGQFVKAFWKSNPKTAAAYKNVILEKVTGGVVRAGVNYANLSSVKDAIEAGDRGEVEALPWGQWKLDKNGKSLFPYIIEHKGVDYIRLYPSDGINHIPKSTYFVDGNEVDKETFAGYLTPSESNKLMEPFENRPACFTIKAENILGEPVDFEES